MAEPRAVNLRKYAKWQCQRVRVDSGLVATISEVLIHVSGYLTSAHHRNSAERALPPPNDVCHMLLGASPWAVPRIGVVLPGTPNHECHSSPIAVNTAR